jgi:hypothetical protein
VLPLADDPFQVVLADGSKQPGSVRLKMPDVKQARIRRHEALEFGLAVDQGQRSEIVAVQPEQIESVEEGLSAVP